MTNVQYPGSVLTLQPSWKCSILVVAADPVPRARLTSLLCECGYTVRSAASGSEALQVLEADPCSIVIADSAMPGMDGATLCRAIRVRDSKDFVYVLIQTSGMSDVLPALAAGADDYLLEGAASTEILSRVSIGHRVSRLEHLVRMSEHEKRELSITDPLTGARDRRYLLKQLPRELDRARRYRHPFAILSCDVDDLQRLTEFSGAEATEDVLRIFVERSRGCLRESIDWIARSGEREFVVVLPETNLSGATCVAEKLRNSLTSRPLSTRAGTVAVTISIGATAIESDEDLCSLTVTELLWAANRCLHVSRNFGRDRATSVPAAQVGSAIPQMLASKKYAIN